MTGWRATLETVILVCAALAALVGGAGALVKITKMRFIGIVFRPVVFVLRRLVLQPFTEWHRGPAVEVQSQVMLLQAQVLGLNETMRQHTQDEIAVFSRALEAIVIAGAARREDLPDPNALRRAVDPSDETWEQPIGESI